ncbi:MAG: hypothetical protein KBC56_06255 [Flavobacterium sp.]|nr:hypothetical protein [Flavobacterium sp.]
MKKFLLFFILFSIFCFGQTKKEWSNIKKVEIYRDSKQSNGTEKQLINLNFRENLIYDNKKIIQILGKIEKPNFDLLTEKSNLFFRITFQNKTETYLVYKKQNVLIKLSKEREFFWLKDKTDFNTFIKNLKV